MNHHNSFIYPCNIKIDYIPSVVCILLTSLTSEPQLASIEDFRIHTWKEMCILTGLTSVLELATVEDF